MLYTATHSREKIIIIYINKYTKEMILIKRFLHVLCYCLLEIQMYIKFSCDSPFFLVHKYVLSLFFLHYLKKFFPNSKLLLMSVSAKANNWCGSFQKKRRMKKNQNNKKIHRMHTLCSRNLHVTVPNVAFAYDIVTNKCIFAAFYTYNILYV